MKARKRRAYCSGLTVDISAPAPYFSVFAALAVRFFTPYRVRISITARKQISCCGHSTQTLYHVNDDDDDTNGVNNLITTTIHRHTTVLQPFQGLAGLAGIPTKVCISLWSTGYDVRPGINVNRSPYYKQDKELSEKMQQRFNKNDKTQGMRGKSYEERLQVLKLWSLEKGRTNKI